MVFKEIVGYNGGFCANVPLPQLTSVSLDLSRNDLEAEGVEKLSFLANLRQVLYGPHWPSIVWRHVFVDCHRPLMWVLRGSKRFPKPLSFCLIPLDCLDTRSLLLSIFAWAGSPSTNLQEEGLWLGPCCPFVWAIQRCFRFGRCLPRPKQACVGLLCMNIYCKLWLHTSLL